MTSKIEAKVTHRFKASADRVYDAWLDPQKGRLWMIGMGDLIMLYGPAAIKYDVAVFACQLGAEPAQVPLVSSDKIQPKKVALWPRWIAGIHAISRSLRSARYHAR